MSCEAFTIYSNIPIPHCVSYYHFSYGTTNPTTDEARGYIRNYRSATQQPNSEIRKKMKQPCAWRYKG